MPYIGDYIHLLAVGQDFYGVFSGNNTPDKEALARKKSEGKQLGRPKGSFATATKLTGKEQIIRELLEKRVSHSAIARILGVNRGTVTSYVKRHQLDRPRQLSQ